jgi:hypothetical protein
MAPLTVRLQRLRPARINRKLDSLACRNLRRYTNRCGCLFHYVYRSAKASFVSAAMCVNYWMMLARSPHGSRNTKFRVTASAN